MTDTPNPTAHIAPACSHQEQRWVWRDQDRRAAEAYPMSDTIYILGFRDPEEWQARHVFTDKALADATYETLDGDGGEYWLAEYQVSDRAPTVVDTYSRSWWVDRGESSTQTTSYLVADLPGWAPEALKSGKLGGYATDVWYSDPPNGSPLFDAPNTIFTPHIGASTSENMGRIAIIVERVIEDYLARAKA